MSDVELMQGTLDLLVLKALTWGPMHGYAVTRWVKDASDGKLAIEDGALYPALHRLERRGWATSAWGVSENNRRAKYYELTPEGRRGLRREVSAWQRYAELLARVLAEPARGAA